jgi:hypothetical protein
MNPQVQARLVEVDEARRRGEWDRALELLRRWAASIEPSVLSDLRGFTGLEAGDPETAALFFEDASRRQPETGAHLAMLLESMNRFRPAEAWRRARGTLEEPDRYEPIVVAFAGDALLDSVPSLPQSEAIQLFRRLVPLLESALEKLEKGEQGAVDLSVLSSCMSRSTATPLLSNFALSSASRREACRCCTTRATQRAAITISSISVLRRILRMVSPRHRHDGVHQEVRGGGGDRRGRRSGSGPPVRPVD